MDTVIIINLNYEAFPIAKCQAIWLHIEEQMVEAGFTKYNRFFLTTMDSKIAYERARSVIRKTEEELLEPEQQDVHFIRDMYGIPFSHIVDLTSPSADEIIVDFMATGTFQKFFSKLNSNQH